MTSPQTHSSTVAVITGGSSGMGLATARKLAEEGCQRLFLLARSTTSLNAAVESIKTDFPKVVVSASVVDVAQYDQVATTFSAIAQELDHINYLFLAAGTNVSENLAESNDATVFERDVQVNLVGTYNCILCAKSLLKEGSSVVTVSSIRGQLPSPSGLGYAAAKGGILALTKSVALQLGPQAVRVNCIAPGAVYPTGMSAHWDEAKRQRIASEAPLKTITTPEEVANVVWFLLSNQSSCLTGQTISCNQGDFML